MINELADVSCDELRVPPRVKRGGGSAVAWWQALSSAMIAWVLPEPLVCLVWEYSFSFIPQGMLYLVFVFFSSLFARTIRAKLRGEGIKARAVQLPRCNHSD
jgi:hypothetical protein